MRILVMNVNSDLVKVEECFLTLLQEWYDLGFPPRCGGRHGQDWLTQPIPSNGRAPYEVHLATHTCKYVQKHT